jgi:hypothetical protein
MGRWDAVDALTFDPEPDYAAIVADRLSESGPRCEGASDAEACEAAIAEAIDSYSGHTFVVLRFGDEVSSLHSSDAIAAALAPVDSPDEAMLVADLAGFDEPVCDDATRGGARAVAGGYEVVMMRDYECVPHSGATTYDEIHYRHLIFVGADGSVEERGREEIHRRVCEDHCICF